MKKTAIRVGVLTAVFIVAVLFFSYLTNKGNTDMSAALSSATLPKVWFTTEGYDVNPLAGHVTDMEITSKHGPSKTEFTSTVPASTHIHRRLPVGVSPKYWPNRLEP